jgi:hypothetical protein
MNAHNPKKLRNKESLYGILAVGMIIYPPPRQHLKFRLSKSDTSKKVTVHKRCRRLIKDLRFSP